jgi:hypothetical protein
MKPKRIPYDSGKKLYNLRAQRADMPIGLTQCMRYCLRIILLRPDLRPDLQAGI